jgi:hypothetical protein
MYRLKGTQGGIERIEGKEIVKPLFDLLADKLVKLVQSLLLLSFLRTHPFSLTLFFSLPASHLLVPPLSLFLLLPTPPTLTTSFLFSSSPNPSLPFSLLASPSYPHLISWPTRPSSPFSYSSLVPLFSSVLASSSHTQIGHDRHHL